MIDGFDPDKFKKVNNKGGGNDNMVPLKKNTVADPDLRIERKIDSANSNRQLSADEPMMRFQEMPGAVPSYDRGERQLLATLEQELGVI